MPRSTGYIDAEISRLETFLQSEQSIYTTIASDGTTRSLSRKDVENRLDELYIQKDRISGDSPMLVRGRLDGLG